jgi:head-tail adaptor
MDAGALDRRVTIQRATLVEGDYGSDETFATLATRWASRKDVSDGEKEQAGGLSGRLVSRFQMRWDTVTALLTTKDRLVCDGRIWDLIGVKLYGGRQEAVELTAVARAD